MSTTRIVPIDTRPARGRHRTPRRLIAWALFLLLAAGVTIGALTLIPSGPHPTAATVATIDRGDDPVARPGQFRTPPPAAPSSTAAAAAAAAPTAHRVPAHVAAAVPSAVPSTIAAEPTADPAPQLPTEVIGRAVDCPDGSVGHVIGVDLSTDCPAAAPPNGDELQGPSMCTDPVDCPVADPAVLP